MRYFTKQIRNNNLEIIYSKENNNGYYDKLNKFLNNLREKYNNNMINVNNISSVNIRYHYDTDEYDFSDENNELNEFEEKSENGNEKFQFSFDLDKTISKFKNPLIGYKRIRYKNDDEEF